MSYPPVNTSATETTKNSARQATTATPPSSSTMIDPLMALVDAATERFDRSIEVESKKKTTQTPSTLQPLKSSGITFLQKLRKILDDDTIDVLQWMPDGKSFHIVHPKQFKSQLRGLFQLQTMSSFLRRLNQLGFTRIHDKVTMNLDIFQHPKFTRDDDTTTAVIVPSKASTKSSSKTTSTKIVTTALSSFSITSRSTSSGSIISTTSSLSLSPRFDDDKCNRPQPKNAAARALPKAPLLKTTTTSVKADDDTNTINSLLVEKLLRERETLLHGMDRLSQTVVSLLQTQPPSTAAPMAYPQQYGAYHHHHHHHHGQRPPQQQQHPRVSYITRRVPTPSPAPPQARYY